MNVEIKQANVIYLTIPGAYTEVYYKLLYLLAAIGKDIIADCNYICHNNGNNVFTCWNVFQSAIAAYNLGNAKEANVLIKYVSGQLDIYVNNENIKVPDNFKDNYPNVTYIVNDDGTINVSVRVNIDGEMYENNMIVPSYDWSYGASDAATPDILLIEDLVKTGGHLVDGEYKITTTKEQPYVWFVSKDELYFEQGGFEVNFNHYYKHYKHWYVSDKLIAGENVYNVSIKNK